VTGDNELPISCGFLGVLPSTRPKLVAGRKKKKQRRKKEKEKKKQE